MDRFALYRPLLDHFIRYMCKDPNASKMTFEGENRPLEILDFHVALTAHSVRKECKGKVAAVQIGPVRSMEFGVIDHNHDRVEQMRSYLDTTHKDRPNSGCQVTEARKQEHAKSPEATLISPRETALGKRGASNAGRHSLRSAQAAPSWASLLQRSPSRRHCQRTANL